MLISSTLVPQGISAELVAAKWEIPRSELDELSYRSHILAARATEAGRFERETMPMRIEMNGASETIVVDQGVRPDTSLEKLSALRPAFPQAADHVGETNLKITAGNSSQISDGAAAVRRTRR